MPGPGSRACPKSRPSLLDRRDKKRAELAEERRVRAAVKKRDKDLCRITCIIDADDSRSYEIIAPHRGDDLHHLLPRSRGGKTDTGNTVWLCRRHHSERHAGVIRIHGSGDGEIHVERIWR